jgi:uncharacterized membrane protein
VARRIDTLDVARGTAMLFVCLSHFAYNFLAPGIHPGISPLLGASATIATTISMVASPTFMSLSGVVFGILYRLEPTGMPQLRRKLIDRGLFLLLIGHFLQVPAYAEPGRMGEALRVLFITDVIGFSIIVGPTLVTRMSPKRRLVVGLALLLLSWIADAAWAPHSGLANAAWAPHPGGTLVLVRYLFGASVLPTFVGFPIVPWFAVYLLATVLGERIGEDVRRGGWRRADASLLRFGLIATTTGVFVMVTVHVARALDVGLAQAHAMNGLHLNQKFPPGPVYLLTFGGLGLVLMSRAFAIASRQPFRYLSASLATLGRASFFVFVLQGYVYYLAIPAIGLPYPQLWPLYYTATVLLFVAASMLWNAMDGNRFLSVGLFRTVPIAPALRERANAAPIAR